MAFISLLMAFVFELVFDPATEKQIREIWRRISDAGLPSSMDADGYRPHISLAVYEADHFHVAACFPKAFAYSRERAPIPVFLSHLGLFTHGEQVVFLGVTPTAELLARHEEMLDLCREQRLSLRPYYAPDRWTPHVTLSFDLTREQAQKILAVTLGTELPISGMATGLHLVEVTPEYARDIFTCEFSG